MKKRISELLKELEEETNCDTCYIQFYSDYSGAVYVENEFAFDFSKELELIEGFKTYISELNTSKK